MRTSSITIVLITLILTACLDLTLFGNGNPEKEITPTISPDTQFPLLKTTEIAANDQDQPLYSKCNKALPGLPLDITIPDGTMLQPGELFYKTWRVRNEGSCDWTGDYSLIWFSGAPFGINNIQRFGKEINPGNTIDITIEMIAPQSPGLYQSNWKLQSPDGELFGIGPDGTAPLWVRIIVSDPLSAANTPTLTPEPETNVYFSAKSTLVVGDQVDLDSSELNVDKEGELRLIPGNGNNLKLETRNGAKILFYGMKMPNYNDCRKELLGIGEFPLGKGEEGIYICYQSQVGLSGYGKITNINLEEKSITLDFVTWAAP